MTDTPKRASQTPKSTNLGGLDPSESRTDISPKTAARPNEPSKPDSRLRGKLLQKHNPAQGTPPIRRNPEAGKPKEQRTNRGAKLPHDAPSTPNSRRERGS